MTEELAGPRRPRRENALLVLGRIPVVRRMWAAITFSSLGDWLGLLANTALAQQLTNDHSRTTQGFAISGVILVRLAPDLLFGPIAAAMADKVDRRKLVIFGDLAAGLLYASIAIGYNLVWLYVAQFVIEAVGLFTQPAKQVIQTTIVPKKLLATANQISLFSVYGTVPIASGIFALLSAGSRLIDKSSVDSPHHINAAIVVALLLNTVSFMVSSGTVFLSRHLIPVAPAEREQAQSVFSLLREGVYFVRHNELIRGLYVGIIGAFAAGGLIVGVAGLWVKTLSAGAAGYSIMFGTVFTGLALGMLLGPKVLPAYTRSRVFGLAIGSAGVALLVMSVIRDFILADFMASLVGLFAGMAWIIGYTLIGQEVEDRLRGRIFAFVLSSVRIMLLLTIAVGPVLAGTLGSHAIAVGDKAHLRFSGPGLTLLIGGLLALGVSYYATSRTTRSRTRLRDIVRRRLLTTDVGRPREHLGLFVSVDGADPTVTAAYAALLRAAVHELGLVPTLTGEPTDSSIGRRVAELLRAGPSDSGVEPETAALLSAADRAEHVATVIRPALESGGVVICDRYVLTSLAVHGGGRGADVERIRSVNAWSTGQLMPDLTLVVARGADSSTAGDEAADSDLTADAVAATLLEAADADPDRCVLCSGEMPRSLPQPVLDRLHRLMRTRGSLLAGEPPASARTGPAPGGIPAR
ncbi:MAG: bifunctional MFS transporter/dTMP kinase [Jatrophihabitans sp.]|uniref:bifunctional MFS transporter/dTMP kinase n=1 Tax=Jatrophihabitans sp. TaxID=1932789 RepID=UPI00390D46A6